VSFEPQNAVLGLTSWWSSRHSQCQCDSWSNKDSNSAAY